MVSKTYEPSGNVYTYIADLDSMSQSYTPLEEKALESRGRTTTYPGEYCNTVVYGGVEMAVDSILTVDARSAIAQIMSVNEFQSAAVNLAKPLYSAFSGATKVTSGMVFGQPEGDTEPSRLVIEAPLSGGVNIKWYKNGEVVATDSIVNLATSIAIAVQYSGNTIRNYAYVFTFNNEIWTTGLKGNAAVIGILNNGGYAGSDEAKYGWTDDEKGEFIYSKIYNRSGNPAYTGWVAGGRVDETIVTANEDLSNRCDNFGGYLGTDIVEYMTGMTSQEAWEFLNSEEGDGTEMSIPHIDGTELKIVWKRSFQLPDSSITVRNVFVIYKNEEYQGYINNIYTTNGAHIYLTWYNQNNPIGNAERLVYCILIRTSGAIVVPQYEFYTLEGGSPALLVDEFSSDELLDDLISGFDPEGGQEDENQDDPEDTEKPENDPLASGFLYAFMVGASDMENLASCLKPDTLAQKIKADFGNNLYEFIVSYHMMPCLTNADSLNKVPIKYRGTPFMYGDGDDTQLQLAPITQTWYRVNCGTRVCKPSSAKRPDGFENWSQAKVQMYLPFIGYVHLNTADVWGEPITVVYEFDILQGTCVANIGVGNKGTIYSYSASCKYTIPFTTTIDMANQQLLSGIFSGLGAAVSVGGAIATGSPIGMLGAASGVADTVGHFLSAAEHQSIINRGGSLSGAPGWLMPRKPALLVTIPDIIEQGITYNNLNGLPCCTSDQLANYQGFYCEVGQIDLKAYTNNNGCSPNDTELDMIRSILKEGVYV